MISSDGTDLLRCPVENIDNTTKDDENIPTSSETTSSNDKAVAEKVSTIPAAAESVTGSGKTKRSRKRLNSFNGQTDGNNGKHKNKRQSVNGAGEIILPNKFLLGGNITDPLNLNSMLDEKVNKSLNASTPSSSPLPPRNTKINMIIPDDMTDPLGLNSCEEGAAAAVSTPPDKQGIKDTISSKGRRKRRRRKSSLNDKSRPTAAESNVDNDEEKSTDTSTTPNRSMKGKKGKQFQKLELQQATNQASTYHNPVKEAFFNN